MTPFTYNALPVRVVFGSGTVTTLGAELERLGGRRALLLCTPEQRTTAEALSARLGDASVGVFADAAMHTPVETTDIAMRVVETTASDVLVAIGGGSAIGLGKALALRTDLAQIVVPTTYAGSEATPIVGQTASGEKTTQRSPRVLPEVILYDVDLTLTLPPALTVTSGLNAMAHAVEALYAADANPVTSLLAEQALRLMGPALRTLVAQPLDTDARSDALYAAWACGTCLGAVAMSLHHKICHVLGGAFGLAHAPTHAVMLPHVAAYNAKGAPGAMRAIARALDHTDAVSGLAGLARDIGAPASLADLGFRRDDIGRAANLVTANPYGNPAPITREGMIDLLEAAFHGRDPSATHFHRS